MSVFILLFLVVLITAATAVCMYRLVSNRQGFKRVVIDIPGITTWMGRKVRQGLLMLTSASRERAKQITLHSPKGGIKTPWGW